MATNNLTLDVLEQAIDKIKEMSGDKSLVTEVRICPFDLPKFTGDIERYISKTVTLEPNIWEGIPVIEDEQLPEGFMVIVYDNGKKVKMVKYAINAT